MANGIYNNKFYRRNYFKTKKISLFEFQTFINKLLSTVYIGFSRKPINVRKHEQ